MSEMPPKTLTFHCVFYDMRHADIKLASHSVILGTHDFKRVYNLLQIAQDQHRVLCEKGGCDRCQGAIFVKSAWLVNIPRRDAENTLRHTRLEHNPDEGIQFMPPNTPLPDHLRFSSDETNDDVIRFLFECTYDKTDKLFNSPKRLRDTEDPESKSPESEVPPRPDGLCIITSADATAPINLPSTSVTFPFHVAGTVSVDKSRFIPDLDALLKEFAACIIAQPPGSGKTVFKWMIANWLDSQNRNHEEMFKHLKIADLVEQQRGDNSLDTQSTPAWSSQSCLCLMFDMRDIAQSSSETPSKVIDTYLCETMQKFVTRCEAELGAVIIPLLESKNPRKVIKRIFKHAGAKNITIFVAVDHWDDPILKSLTSSPTATQSITIQLTEFIITLATGSGLTRQLRKVLILGNLPLFFDGRPTKTVTVRERALKDISLSSSMNGAFGMTPTEVDSLFLVLGHGRRVELNRLEPGLEHRLGVFSPPRIVDDDDPPAKVFNFNLVLYHAASTLALPPALATTPDSTLLATVVQLCSDLLSGSNFRRMHSMVLPQLFTDPTPLEDFIKKAGVLWRLLFFLGVLKVIDQTRPGDPIPTWTVQIASTSAYEQLFSRFAKIPPRDLRDTIQDRRIRALCEHNPLPLGEALAFLLSSAVTSLLDLYDMPEAVFQAMFNCYMNHEAHPYFNHYFAQLGLFTDSAQPRYITGRNYRRRRLQGTLAGSGRFGYVDIFIRRILGLSCVIPIELKCLRIRGFIRAMYETEDECTAAVDGVEGDSASFRRTCLQKIEELNKMTIEELRAVDYHFYSKGSDDKWKGNKVSVGAILDDAADQLRSYMNAISNGSAQLDGDHPAGTKPEGVLDWRIKVDTVHKNAADRIFGVVFCAIGRRIVSVVVDHVTKPESPLIYRFQAREGWQKDFENNSSIYPPAPESKEKSTEKKPKATGRRGR